MRATAGGRDAHVGHAESSTSLCHGIPLRNRINCVSHVTMPCLLLRPQRSVLWQWKKTRCWCNHAQLWTPDRGALRDIATCVYLVIWGQRFVIPARVLWILVGSASSFTLHHTVVSFHAILMFHATTTYMSASIKYFSCSLKEKQKCVLQCSPTDFNNTQFHSLLCIYIWDIPVPPVDTEALETTATFCSCYHNNNNNNVLNSAFLVWEPVKVLSIKIQQMWSTLHKRWASPVVPWYLLCFDTCDCLFC